MNLIFILVSSPAQANVEKSFFIFFILMKLDVMTRNIDNIKPIMQKSSSMFSYFSENLEGDIQNEKIP